MRNDVLDGLAKVCNSALTACSNAGQTSPKPV
jgi:hypothetical protein